MSKVVVMKKGKQVASSKDLSVILRYQRVKGIPITSVSQRNKTLYVKYEDGASVKTDFKDSEVLRQWIRKKRIRGVFPPKNGKVKKKSVGKKKKEVISKANFKKKRELEAHLKVLNNIIKDTERKRDKEAKNGNVQLKREYIKLLKDMEGRKIQTIKQMQRLG